MNWLIFTQILKSCTLNVPALPRDCLVNTLKQRRDPAARSRAKLPKLEVPTFNGEILRWRTFWDMFEVSVHKQKGMSNPEKLLYLRQAVNSGPNTQVIEGLSHTGDQYEEAITCFKKRYDQPRAVHEAYVKVIVEYSKMKDGTGNELRKLHDTMLQNLRALSTLGQPPDPQFMTSLIQLKLDSTTSFAWREASKDTMKEVPDCEAILKFLDQRARSADDEGTNKKPPHFITPPKKYPKNVAAHLATGSTSGNCSLCQAEKHPLYVCPKFKAMPITEKRNTLTLRDACFNCLRTGHRAIQCQSSHRCKRCQKHHHTILHQEQGITRVSEGSQPETPKPASAAEQQVTSIAAVTIKSSSLLMTCVSAPNGSSMEARAILDTGSTASFITERLANALKLPRAWQAMHISGITGASTGAPTQSDKLQDLSHVWEWTANRCHGCRTTKGHERHANKSSSVSANMDSPQGAHTSRSHFRRAREGGCIAWGRNLRGDHPSGPARWTTWITSSAGNQLWMGGLWKC